MPTDANEHGQVDRTFADNLSRLMGMHGLSSTFTAHLLGVTPASLSAWLNGRASPSLSKAVAIADLFAISTDRLLRAPFVDLLGNELAEQKRFEEVEERIRQQRTGSSSR